MADPQHVGTIGIMAGIPEVPTAFLLSFRQMEAHCQQHMFPPGVGVKLAVPGSTDHALARNEIVEASEGEWTLFLDCDHYVEATLLHRLVLTMYGGQDMTKPPECLVVTGLYFKRRAWWQNEHETRYPQLYAWSIDPEKEGGICPLDYLSMLKRGAIEPGQPFHVEACGGGCLLVHRSVFERMAAEWPKEKPFDNVIAKIGRMGEDVSFCWRCKQLGIPIVCAPSAESYHKEEHYLRLSEFWSPEPEEVTADGAAEH